MFKTLSFLASTALAVDTSLEGASCFIANTAEFAYFDLGAMTNKEKDYTKGDVTFNFCKYATWPDSGADEMDTFAFQTGKLNKAHALTEDGQLAASETKSHVEGDSSWVELHFETTYACQSDPDKKSSLTYHIDCDKDVTGEGQAKIDSVDSAGCHVTIKASHKAGCPTQVPFVQFLHDHPYVIGAIFICAGLFTGLFGKSMFKYVLWTIVSVVTVFLAMIMCSLFGWMDTNVGVIVCFFLSCGLAFGAAYLVTRSWMLKFIFFILGACAGFFLGLFLYTMILALIGEGPAWLMLAFGVTCAILLALLACKNRFVVLMISTSTIGSYWFIRGLAYFFGNYPNESEIYTALSEGQSVSKYLTNWFWLYFGIFVVCVFVSMFVQVNADDKDDEYLDQDEDFKRQRQEDAYFSKMKRNKNGNQTQQQ